MKIKKGDNVIVLTGKDKGKTAKVLRALPIEEKVILEGVNIAKKHSKNKFAGDKKGEIVEVAMPMEVSNVAILDPKDKKPTRIGYKVVDGKKVRIAKRSGQEIK
jgi:large subunit ribosomal protein L24